MKSLLYTALAVSAMSVGCSVLTKRPVQEMSDTVAAIRAAKEVSADTSSPELYRQAQEWYGKAKTEYRLKNFSRALDFTLKAREYAEQAEFEAIRGGAARADPPPPPELPAPPEPYAYPTPTGTPAADYERRRQEELQRQAPPSPFSSSATPSIGSNPPPPSAAPPVSGGGTYPGAAPPATSP